VCDEVRVLQKAGTTRQLNPLKNSTGIRYKAYEPFNQEQHMELLHRCQTQQWVGVCDAKFAKYGRALVSLQRMKKHDIIVDYHGLVVEGMSLDDYSEANPQVSVEYCVVVEHKPKRIIDATSETCINHPRLRCLGRLANHAHHKRGAANMVMTDVLLDMMSGQPRVVVLQARLDIEPFEQLRFDYNDRVARALFED
jgi:hypothetical protein